MYTLACQVVLENLTQNLTEENDKTYKFYRRFDRTYCHLQLTDVQNALK